MTAPTDLTIPPLTLASTSPYRRALLERLGVPFRCVAPGVDEEAFKALNLLPQELADRLALEKARAVAVREPGAVVIGSDQLADCGGQILGKPGDAARAAEQLASLAGREHELITALAVVHPGGVETHTNIARLRMRELTAQEISRYVEADRPFDCAGSYKLEERGIALFQSIVSDDHTAITGLPLIALTTILRRLGYRVP